LAKRKTARQKRTRVARPSPVASPPAPTVASPPPAAPTSSGTDELRAEYQYVLTDLKRIGITTAAMFALLVVLALVIT